MRSAQNRGKLVIATALAAVLGLASPAWAEASNTTVTATPQSAAVGAPVVLAATVDCPADPTGGPEVGVVFFAGNIQLPLVPVDANGLASYTYEFTTAGTHTITASYSGNGLGDGECSASSGTTTVQVTSAPTPPNPTPGFCLLACGGLINFSVGDITNNINISEHNYGSRNQQHQLR
ncbi:Ig-like domain-containing protein [Streptomyces sp. NPDC060209]|uniref:Ig-like domain-containing protein n=1 Tax=Streptomyces sp. NPDC060209 TaxID=3347073 RepID=UPI003668E4ED